MEIFYMDCVWGSDLLLRLPPNCPSLVLYTIRLNRKLTCVAMANQRAKAKIVHNNQLVVLAFVHFLNLVQSFPNTLENLGKLMK